jgi:cell division protein ZapA
MSKSIRVRVLGREYSLRVEEDHEELALEIAAFVDNKMRAFRKAHPDQHEVTAGVITALAIAEELFTERRSRGDFDRWLEDELQSIDAKLADALDEESDGA